MELQETYNGFVCVNADKLHRTIYGSIGAGGKLYGGLLEKHNSVEEIPAAEILARYDQLGGLITKDNRKIKTGAFYDLEHKKPREKPEIVYLVRAVEDDGEGGVRVVNAEVKDGEALPMELKAKAVKKVKRGRPKKDAAKSSEGETLEG